ncbi:MAG: DUF4402 domain-containing protein [Bacteroidota bacterium]|nr:DUF4402 domain-containing protein [Bacteroidota bacterium]
MKWLTIIVGLFLISYLPVVAQSSVTGKMEAEISIPVTAVETELLNFGKIVPETGGGTIKITSGNERTATGDITLLDDVFNAGKFVVSAVPNSLVSITLPQTTQKLTLANGNAEIGVDNFESNVPVGGQVIRQSDGKAEVSIGATLHIGNGLSNPAGFYTGTYEVVFMYN